MKTDISPTTERPAARAKAVPDNTEPSLTSPGKKPIGESSTRDDWPRLTWREQETLAYLQLHLSDKEIAGRLDLELSSVKSRVRWLLRKFGVRSRRELHCALYRLI